MFNKPLIFEVFSHSRHEFRMAKKSPDNCLPFFKSERPQARIFAKLEIFPQLPVAQKSILSITVNSIPYFASYRISSPLLTAVLFPQQVFSFRRTTSPMTRARPCSCSFLHFRNRVSTVSNCLFYAGPAYALA